MNNRDPKPDIQRIEELVTSVINGFVRLPKFQRPFVWKRKEVLRLLDSIYKGYPIGSILLWNTSEKLISERSIADLEISSDDAVYPTNYILDGQQRISSLCGALYWEGQNNNSIWNIAFDLDKEEFLHPDAETRVEYFPLNKLLSTSSFIDQCKGFETHDNKEKFFRNAEKLLRSIKDYKIAVVKIGDMTITEVSPIFERINSSGRKLTVVDLMRAATWSGGFDLNDAIKKVKKICEELDFNNVPDTHILRNISACAGFGINREDIDKMRNMNTKELEAASIKCAEAYEKAILFLKDNLPLVNYDYLPYGLQLTLIVEFFNVNTHPSQYQKDELILWFWRTSLSRHFGTSNTGQNSRDLDRIRKFARDEIDKLPIDKNIILDRLLYDDFRLNIANSKTFALLLAKKQPRDLFTGEKIDISKAFSVVNRNEFSLLVNPSLYRDRNLNICNNIIVYNSKERDAFSEYKLPFWDNFSFVWKNYLMDNEAEKLNDILDSNFLSYDSFMALALADADTFFSLRKDIFKKEIESLTKMKTVPNTGFGNIDNEEEEDSDLFS